MLLENANIPAPSNPVIPKLWRSWQSSGVLVKTQVAVPHPEDFPFTHPRMEPKRMFPAFTPLVPKQSMAVFKAWGLPVKTLRFCEKSSETPRRPGFPFEQNRNVEKLQ